MRGKRLLTETSVLPATIPERRDQQANRLRRGRAGGRPRRLQAPQHHLKQFRAIATRSDKTATSYRSMVDLLLRLRGQVPRETSPATTGIHSPMVGDAQPGEQQAGGLEVGPGSRWCWPLVRLPSGKGGTEVAQHRLHHVVGVHNGNVLAEACPEQDAAACANVAAVPDRCGKHDIGLRGHPEDTVATAADHGRPADLGEDELAELSVRVVLYRRNQDGELSPVYPDSDDLRESATVLAAPVNVPTAVVRALLDVEVPADFAADPWLNRHRALVFTDGRIR
ncbi:hypothetical protein [Amycolatopsis australiensis]|uniref:hypothetical protein n=1 Tax=Amycolatopsis australiensis TaxID=546364 RepID=UPI003CCC1694